jgi:hypothetical protein
VKRLAWAALFAGILTASCTVRVGEGGRVERPGELVDETESVERGKAEIVHVELSMGAGQLVVEGGTEKLMEGEFRYNIPSWKPEVHYEEDALRGRLSVKQGAGSASMGKATNEWHVWLSDKTPLDLEVKCGAGESRLDLRGMNLRSVEVKMGAGRVELDLRSEHPREFEVEVEGGVGEALIRVPKDWPVEARARGGLGNVDIRGLNREDDGVWVSPARGAGKPALRLNVRGGIGEIKIYAE